MKLQVQTTPTVAPDGAPQVSISTGGPGGTGASGLRELAAGLADAGRAASQAERAWNEQQAQEKERAAREAEHARQQAIAAQTAEAEAHLQDRLTQRLYSQEGKTFDVVTSTGDGSGEPLSFTQTDLKGPKGFLSTRGAEASAGRGALLDAMGQDQKEIEQSLTTPEAQQMFRARTAAMLNSARRDVEVHVSRENQVALKASVVSSQSAALRAIAADPLGPDSARAAQQAMGPTYALAEPGEGDQAVRDWQGKVAATRIDALLSKKDWENADSVVKGAGDTLAPHQRAAAEKQIAAVKLDAQADQLATGAIVKATNERGQVDVDKVVAQFDGSEPDLHRAALRSALQRARAINQAWDAQTKEVKREAGAQFNVGGFHSIPPALREELNKRDPDYYRRLRDYEENQYLRRQAAGRGGAAAFDREQERINRDALRAYNAKPMEERAGLDVPTEFAGTGVNKSGMDLILGHQQTDKARLKTHGERENAFVSEVVNEAKGRRQVGVTGATAKMNEASLRSEATETFQNWVTEHEGALPSTEDADKLKNRLLQKQLVPGRFWGTNEVPAWKQSVDQRAKGQQPKPKPSKAERAKALNAQGKSLKEIADTLNAEGY